MIEVIAQFELEPASWPAITGITGDPLKVAWQRVESHIARRFAERTVTWLLESAGGEWAPPLQPVQSLTAKRWDGSGYDTVTLASAPGGYRVLAGRYEITAQVGDGPVPAAVAEAVKRLAEYYATHSGLPAGLRTYSAQAGQLSERPSGDANAAGKALQYSGAADLLRRYRRARHAVV